MKRRGMVWFESSVKLNQLWKCLDALKKILLMLNGVFDLKGQMCISHTLSFT